MLIVKNLSVSIHDKPILDGLSLTVETGQVAAIMGPNGSGKSTLSYVVAGKPDYEVTGGEIWLNGENLLELAPEERAAKGVFLAFQYPVEIPGVATMTFLKAAMNAQRRSRGEKDMTTPDFIRLVKGAAQSLKVDMDMLKRPVNVGFSGGEKKRIEILQMALLHPSLLTLGDFEAVEAAPLLVLFTANDQQVSDSFRAEIVKVLDAKNEVKKPATAHHFYSDQAHGFSLRGDDTDPKVAAAAGDAFDRTAAWLKEHGSAK